MISRCLECLQTHNLVYWISLFHQYSIPQYIPATKAHIVLFGDFGQTGHLRIGESSRITHVSSPSIWILGQPCCLCPSLNFGAGDLIQIIYIYYRLPAIGAWGLSSAILAWIAGCWYTEAFDNLVQWQVDFSPRHGKTVSWKEECPLQGTQNHPLLGFTNLDRMHGDDSVGTI